MVYEGRMPSLRFVGVFFVQRYGVEVDLGRWWGDMKGGVPLGAHRLCGLCEGGCYAMPRSFLMISILALASALALS